MFLRDILFLILYEKNCFRFIFLTAINMFSQIQNFLYKNDFDNPLVNDPMGINGSNSMSLKMDFCTMKLRKILILGT